MKNIKPDNKRCVLIQTFDGENLFGVVKDGYIEVREPLKGFRGTSIGFEGIRKWVYESEVNIFMD